MANIAYEDQDHPTTGDIEAEIQEYMVNVMRRRMGGAAMNKETWESISDEGKQTWDQMSPADK